ncbi:MAG: TonB family protein [Thermodesulfovibrionales bacterium]|nr:TonB family protein [Thermodesulfovibrionales bacterium]
MREPRLYLSFSYSFFLHLVLVVVVVLIFNKTTSVKTHKTYMVSIVSVLSTPSPMNEQPASTPKETNQPPSNIQPQKKITETSESKKTQKKTSTETSVEDRISEIRAKKRLETLASLRKNIDISDSKRLTNSKGTMSSQVGQKGVDDYLSLVRTMIMQKWVYPDRIEKDLEAIIAIRIQKDGRVSIVGIEKSSGNRLFDRSALSAINSLSVLPKPPEGVEEIGIRFKP